MYPGITGNGSELEGLGSGRFCFKALGRLLMKRFFYREKGNHDEAWYYLARDNETGVVYVECQWAVGDHLGSNRIEIADFLSGPARANLLRLIGTLVTEAGDAPAPAPLT
jgi:hypothetical protein